MTSQTYNSVESYLQAKEISPLVVSGGEELRIVCPYCQNPKQKCYVRSGTGVFYCFHCGVGGSLARLKEKLGSKNDQIETRPINLQGEPDLPPLNQKDIEENHQRLLAQPALLDWLHNHRGYNDETIKKFKLGWDGRSICIPIRNFHGEVVNIKFRRDPTIPTGTKSMWGMEGRNSARLFNEEILKTKPKGIVVAEGEWDAMLLDRLGFPAVTSTAGAQTNFDKWVEAFDGIETYICYDNDKNNAGQAGAQKVAESFRKKGKKLKIITLPDPKILEEKVDITNYFVDLKFTKEDFKQLIRESDGIAYQKERLLPSERLTFNDLMKVLNDYWLNPDENAIKIIFSVLIAFRLNCDPLWVFLVAPPSSLKTEFITGLSLIEDIYNLSSLTPQTLASGLKEKGKKNFSLLSKIGSKVLTFKDFTTVLSGRWDDLQKILSQFREVYDGRFVAEYGTGVKIDWRGKMGFIAGTTQIIDQHSTVSAMLGERFIQYRMPGINEVKMAMKSMANAGRSSSIREEVVKLFKRFFLSIRLPEKIDDIVLSQDQMLKIAYLASFVVKARSGTVRDSRTRDLIYIPDPEAPARLAQQLSILIRCLAVVDGKKQVEEEQYRIVLKTAFDCVPRQRILALNKLFEDANNGQFQKFTTRQVAEAIDYSTHSTGWFLEDLHAFGLVSQDKQKENKTFWWVSKATEEYFINSLVDSFNRQKSVTNILQWFRVNRNSISSSNTLPDNKEKNIKFKIQHYNIPSFSSHAELPKNKPPANKNEDFSNQKSAAEDPEGEAQFQRDLAEIEKETNGITS